jgi:hypothetical protein
MTPKAAMKQSSTTQVPNLSQELSKILIDQRKILRKLQDPIKILIIKKSNFFCREKSKTLT